MIRRREFITLVGGAATNLAGLPGTAVEASSADCLSGG
jgi:hypothetical protein